MVPEMTRRMRSLLVVLAVSMSLLATAPAARAEDDYDAKRAGHPLRVAAYILHPVGVILDRILFRPAYWLGSHEPLRTLFGRTDED